MKTRHWQGLLVTATCALVFAGPAAAADSSGGASSSMTMADGRSMSSSQMLSASPSTTGTMTMGDGTKMSSSQMPSPTPPASTMDPSMPGMEGSANVMPSIATPEATARQRVLAGFAFLNVGILVAAALTRRSRQAKSGQTETVAMGAK